MQVNKNVIRLSKDTLIYGIGSALHGFIGFLLFPIYTRFLSKTDFGIQDLILSFTIIVTYFLVLGLDSGCARNYYDSNSESHKVTILSTWLWFEVIITFPVLVLFEIFSFSICQNLFNNTEFVNIFRIGILTIPFSIFYRIVNITLRLSFQAGKFSTITIVGTLIHALSAILFVVIFRLGIIGVFYAQILSNFIQFIFGLYFTYKYFKFTFSFTTLKPMLLFGIPLLPASLMIWIMNYSNRLFLTRMVSLSDIGLLSIATRLTQITGLLISAFQFAWPPFAYSLLDNLEIAKQTYSKVLTYFFLITILISSFVSILSRELVFVLASSSYENSASLVPWLSYSAILWGAIGITSIGYESYKKSYHTLISVAIGVLLTTVLNFILISKIGVLGAVLSTLSGNFVALVYCLYAAQKYLYVPYEYKKLICLILISLFSVMLGLKIDRTFLVCNKYALVLKFLILSLFLFFVFSLKISTIKELKSLIILIKDNLLIRKNKPT